MIKIKEQELIKIYGGCIINRIVLSRIKYIYRYLKITRLMAQLFET